ncbi:NADH-quinone oxidoreductase subunit N [Rhodospirillum rubrum]|uniref:NADH-quinone oxidoreductase subunit NuoN n=1 Tax=Rhodospirillum rubrum TaxID=1085 RepID=UPI0019043436|nr:NADH-quinone oxidoreductase subunit NuoN [Rhodospirillum rubrum]MBK1663312.1 NADH-quinone oxidoreductase subunit N [Rhodospirillum rubrum]MBK1675123.1 NADH-quinone oxidoreductase subunit N [Rhodospirillum rubrum]
MTFQSLILGPALPEILLAVLGLVLLMVGVFRKTDSTGLVGLLAVYGLLMALAVVGLGAAPETPQLAFGGLFIDDGFARYAKALTLLGAVLTLLLSMAWLKRENEGRFEFPILVLFATIGMMMMISANDLIALYMGLELQSLALYVIAAYQRDNLKSTEAGLKYFVLGALASGLLLYGMSLVYGFAGTTRFDGLAQVASAEGGISTGLLIGIVFIIAGLAFKVSAVPFHMWAPDVYEGAPTPVTAFFAVAPKIAALTLFARVMMGPFAAYADQWQQVIILISILSMLLGGFAAIVQTNIKRLMAYSSIGHVGYALIGIAAGTTEGIRGVLVYLAIYLFMNVGTFTVILAMRQKGRAVEGINDLAGLSKQHPMMAAAMAVFMFSMAGVPPLAGFFGKFYVFMAAVNSGLFALAVIGVLSSVVAAFYYLRIIKLMYFDEAAEPLDALSGTTMKVILIGTATVVALFFLAPAVVVDGAQAAAEALTFASAR